MAVQHRGRLLKAELLSPSRKDSSQDFLLCFVRVPLSPDFPGDRRRPKAVSAVAQVSGAIFGAFPAPELLSASFKPWHRSGPGGTAHQSS